MLLQFNESHFTLRDKVSHRQQCLLLSTDLSASVSINRNSILNELRYQHILSMFICEYSGYCCSYFHVCGGGLLPDIMHDVLEGALQYEVKLMLREMIKEDKIFSLCKKNKNKKSQY